MEVYLKYWSEEFGFPPTMPEFAKRQRMRYLEQKWTDEERVKKLQNLRQRCQIDTMKRFLQTWSPLLRCDHSDHATCPIDPSVRLRLRICDEKVKCYDVTSLVNISEALDGLWMDPEEDFVFNDDQIRLIKRVYERVAPQKSSAERWKQDEEYRKSLPRLPKDYLDKLIPRSNSLFGLINMKDIDAYRLLEKGKLLILDGIYGFHWMEFVDKHVMADRKGGALWTNPFTGRLLSRDQQSKIWMHYISASGEKPNTK